MGSVGKSYGNWAVLRRVDVNFLPSSRCRIILHSHNSERSEAVLRSKDSGLPPLGHQV